LSFLVWNVNGLKNTLRDPDFLQIVCKYDILLFSETWQTEHAVYEIDGFKCYSLPRVVCNSKYDAWNRGGVSIYYKPELDSGIQVVSANPLGIVWIKLSKVVFGFEDDICVCLSYIPPHKSPVYHSHDVDFFEIIQDDCSKYSSEGQIIVCGDLNARVSNRLDYIVSTGKVCHQAENLLDTAIELPTRVSCDVQSNTFGGKLIDL
jgi:exonuclease III